MLFTLCGCGRLDRGRLGRGRLGRLRLFSLGWPTPVMFPALRGRGRLGNLSLLTLGWSGPVMLFAICSRGRLRPLVILTLCRLGPLMFVGSGLRSMFLTMCDCGCALGMLGPRSLSLGCLLRPVRPVQAPSLCRSLRKTVVNWRRGTGVREAWSREYVFHFSGHRLSLGE